MSSLDKTFITILLILFSLVLLNGLKCVSNYEECKTKCGDKEISTYKTDVCVCEENK